MTTRISNPVRVAALWLAMPVAAHAATITVDSTDDALTTDSNCTLREAILAANTDTAVDGCTAGETGVDTISVPAGTYTLALTGLDEDWDNATTGTDPYIPVEVPDAQVGDLDIRDSLIIEGAGSATTTIAWAADEDRIFQVIPDAAITAAVTISGLTLTGGYVGSEIINPGDPQAQQWTLRRLGGAIAVGPGTGVKLFGASGADVDNGGPPEGHDEAAFGDASLTLDDVVIRANESAADGGGVYVGGDLTISNSVFDSNVCAGNGGAMYAEGDLDFDAVAFIDNDAEGGGAAFFTGPTTGTIANSLIARNYAIGGGGLSLRSLVDITLVNTTIHDNEAFDVGGGVYTNGSVALEYCTVTDNIAGGDADFGGGGLNSFSNGTFDLEGTLLAGNLQGTAAANCGCTGGTCTSADVVTSSDFNLEDDDTCALTATNDIVDTDPMLGSFDDHGGPLETWSLEPGSPAVDAGGNGCGSTDARGVARPADGDDDGTEACDIGAFELSPLEFDGDGDGYSEGLDIDGETWILDGSTEGDCDDSEAAVFPDATEVCNGIDDDCDGDIDDEDADVDLSTGTTWYSDGDGDGYGTSDTVEACDEPADYAEIDGDCDDSDAAVNPGADEVFDNDIDDDCDGDIDRDDSDYEGCGCSASGGGPLTMGWPVWLVLAGLLGRRRR